MPSNDHDRPNNPLTPEEEERLYAARQAARDAEECDPEELELQPDVAPVPDVGKCDDEPEPLEGEFQPAADPPGEELPADALPGGITVLSQEQSTSCPVGTVVLSGSDPSVTPAGFDTQVVFLDAITAIPLDELFRLAAYVPGIQTLADNDLADAVNTGYFTDFEQDLVDLTGATASVAALIRQALQTAQNLADSIALASAQAGLVCGYLNDPFYVICSDSDPGWETIPGADGTLPPPTEVLGDKYVLEGDGTVAVDENWDGAAYGDIVEFNGSTWDATTPDPDGITFVAAGEVSSQTSQAEADDLAARLAAFELNCVVSNAEQTATCADLGIGIDGATTIDWPTNWVVGPLADSYPFATWYDWETNTTPTLLSTLHGQEFITQSDVGTGEKRVLTFTVTIAANDPRAVALTQAAANEIALNLALAELDCFVPSRPRLLDCIDNTAGDVYLRYTGLGYSDSSDANRDSMVEEMRGGSAAADGGPLYERTNYGIVYWPPDNAVAYEDDAVEYDGELVTYGTPSAESFEALDETPAFEVYVWPGFVAGTDEASANDTAEAYGTGFLQCLWISPKWRCTCVDSVPLGPDESAKFDNADVVANDATLIVAKSSPLDPVSGEPWNEVGRGQILSSTYPNKDADPGMTGAYQWPDLEEICEAGLQCFFEACKVVFCEPQPDDREYKVNGMPNYASTVAAWDAKRPASPGDHSIFLNEWENQLATSLADPDKGLSNLCSGYLNPDGCDAESNPENVVDQGPSGRSPYGSAASPRVGPHGMPARFKFGGVLRRGRRWVLQSNTGEGGGQQGDVVPGGTLPCSEVEAADLPPGQEQQLVPQVSDPWGFFSGAEGFAESLTPYGLSELAVADAKSRIDCTHLAWPRHLINCREVGQKQFGPVPFVTNIAVEASNTRDANEQLENLLYQIMECADPHNFMITISRGSGELTLQGPSFAKLGDDDCIPKGHHPAVLHDEACEPIPDNGANLEISGPTHLYIVVQCCPDTSSGAEAGDEVKTLTLLQQPGTFSQNDALTAFQKGELGLPEGVEFLNTFRATADKESEIWYIASVWVNPDPLFKEDKVVVQAHTGPIVFLNSCCPGSSSSGSSEGSSQGSSQSSGSSESSGSSGGSSGGSGGSGGPPSGGSDKSSAIVPMPWHQKGYGALFTMESNEVLFEFILRDVKITGRETRLPVDKRFLWVCEADSMVVTGAPNGDRPGSISARVEPDGSLVLTSGGWPSWVPFVGRPERATLRLTGVRKGFEGFEMPERSKKQFLQNEEWLNSAYDAE